MRKSTKKFKATKKKTICNTIEKDGGGFDPFEATPKERRSTKGS
jgi:hypothetical protein